MRWSICLLVTMLLAGCGNRETAATGGGGEPQERETGDTTGLSAGASLIAEVEPYRVDKGALRVRGRFEVPDGTRMQISIYDEQSNEMLSRSQMTVLNRRFDSPPVVGPAGPIPRGKYRVEFLAHFNPAWQPEPVLLATDHGRRLRGVGMTRDQQGGAVFHWVERRSL